MKAKTPQQKKRASDSKDRRNAYGQSNDEHFESFFNLDLASGFVFWNEKDPDYREPLIRGLSVAA